MPRSDAQRRAMFAALGNKKTGGTSSRRKSKRIKKDKNPNVLGHIATGAAAGAAFGAVVAIPAARRAATQARFFTGNVLRFAGSGKTRRANKLQDVFDSEARKAFRGSIKRGVKIGANLGVQAGLISGVAKQAAFNKRKRLRKKVARKAAATRRRNRIQ